MISRRQILLAGGLWFTGLLLGPPRRAPADQEAAEILMMSDAAGGRVGFDPIGLLVRPGQTIRWINAGDNVHSTTAYHPAFDQRQLRIPTTAIPWDSGILLKRGDRFEVKLTVEGIYDYYCAPHEAAGMVGRIIVADKDSADAGTLSTYPDMPEHPNWKRLPQVAIRQLPSLQAIMEMGRVSLNK